MDSASKYLSMSEPDKANHLWKYTPWRRVHPTGKITEIPELASATLSLSMMDGSEIPSGVSLVRGSGGDLDLSMDNALTNSFLHAMADSSNWRLIVESGFRLESPMILDVQTGDVASAMADSIELDIEPGIYHIVNSGSASWYELAKYVSCKIQSDCEVLPVKTKEFKTLALRPRYSVLDNSKIGAFVGTLPSWKDAVDRYLKAKGYL